MYLYEEQPDKIGWTKCRALGLEMDYFNIRNGLFDMNGHIRLVNPVKRANVIISAIMIDYPELFWFDGKWKMVEYLSGEKYIVPLYNRDSEAVEHGKQQMKVMLNSFDEMKGYSQKQIAREIYRLLPGLITFGSGANGEGQTAYEAMVEQKAASKGIAKAYQIILGKYGIFSVLLAGNLDDAGKHVWNVAKLDGRYYHVDVCMGYDNFSYLYRGTGQETDPDRGFMLSDQEIMRNHKIVENSPFRIKCE